MNVLSPHIALYRLFDVADEIDLGRLSTPLPGEARGGAL